jgi:hypothetical protein
MRLRFDLMSTNMEHKLYAANTPTGVLLLLFSGGFPALTHVERVVVSEEAGGHFGLDRDVPRKSCGCPDWDHFSVGKVTCKLCSSSTTPTPMVPAMCDELLEVEFETGRCCLCGQRGGLPSFCEKQPGFLHCRHWGYQATEESK